jgi:signal transduction histidine kinase
MISHEIRNPLSAVLHCSEEIIEAMKKCAKYTQTALEASPIADYDAYTELYYQVQNAIESANTIMYCVQHQKQIVDDVLTLSKLDGDLLVVSPVPIQPVALVRTSLKIFEPELRMTDITLTIKEDDSFAALGVDWILLDPNRFLQVST